MEIPNQSFSPLSKREYFAAVALQGILSGSLDPSYHSYNLNHPQIHEMLCKLAVSLADEMIKQLDKPNDQESSHFSSDMQKHIQEVLHREPTETEQSLRRMDW